MGALLIDVCVNTCSSVEYQMTRSFMENVFVDIKHFPH